MKHFSAFLFPLALFVFSFFAPPPLLAQWSPSSLPGSEDVFRVMYTGDETWVLHAGSGVYRSTNRGDLWQLSIAAANDYGCALAGQGADLYFFNYGQGLFHSPDRGLTWQKLPMPLPNWLTNLEAGSQAAFFIDSGTLYRMKKSGSTAPELVLQKKPINPAKPMQMRYGGGGLWAMANDSLFRSADEGDSWAFVKTGLNLLSFDVKGDTVLGLSASSVWRSANAGATWAKLVNSNLGTALNAGESAWFASAENRPLYRSTDGGSTWKPVAQLPTKHYDTYQADQHGSEIMVASLQNYGLFRSLDGAQSWDIATSGLAIDDVASNVVNLYRAGDVAVGNQHFSEDGGQTWFAPVYPVEYYLGLNDVVELKGQFFAHDFNRDVYRSEGNLRQWQKVSTLAQSDSRKLVSTGEGLFLLTSTWTGQANIVSIYQSTDQGSTWTPTTTLTNVSYSSVVGHQGALFQFQMGYGLFKSTDGGINWKSTGAGLGVFGQFSNSANLYASGKVLYVYDYGNIAASTDGGLTFSLINNNLRDASGNKVGAEYLAADGDNIVVLNYKGIYFGKGLSDQWASIKGNLPHQDFFSEKVLISKGRIIVTDYYQLWSRPLSTLQLAEFSGRVWHDHNANGQPDPGEPPYAGAVVQAGVASFATSKADGTYSFLADLTNDSLRVLLPAPWVQASPAFYTVSASAAGRDFGLYFPPDITDVSVNQTSLTVFRPGFEEKIYLSYRNSGTAEANATLRFVPTAPLTFVSASPMPDATSGDTLIWHLPTLQPKAQGHIVAVAQLPPTVPIGSTVGAWCGIQPDRPDANPADNQSLLQDFVFGSFDPNDKRCAQGERITPAQVAAREPLTYTVRFQNTGNYPAEFVRIADTLSSHLDPATFQFLASSHPCTVSLRGRGVVEFFFKPIDLPPSSFNEPASNGFVTYSVRPKAGLALGTPIRNTAYIYFDYNPAIVTNTTQTTVSLPVSGTQDPAHAAPGILLVSPNPSDGFFNIETGSSDAARVMVFNVLGKKVAEVDVQGSSPALSLRHLPQGLYTLLWTSENGLRKTGRVQIVR